MPGDHGGLPGTTASASLTNEPARLRYVFIMTRRMADESFLTAQWDQRYATHLAPINEFVDRLRVQAWAPYVAPIHGGVDARVLTLLRDPGPATQDTLGSGFLSIENDDPTAARLNELLASAGLGASDTVLWNAYPWYINRAPNAAELDEGVGPILDLIALMPKLKVVLLQGGSARDSWRRVTRRAPKLVGERGLTVIDTYHPGRQALWHKDPAVRADRLTHQLSAYEKAAATLRQPRVAVSND